MHTEQSNSTDADSTIEATAPAKKRGGKGRRAGVVYEIHLVRERAKLPPRNEPYYYRLGTNRFIGYRKSPETGEETWSAKTFTRAGKKVTHRLGVVTKHNTYDVARANAETWFQLRTCAGGGMDAQTTVATALHGLLQLHAKNNGGTVPQVVRLAVQRIIKEDAEFAHTKCVEVSAPRIEAWRTGLVYLRGKTKGNPLAKVTQDRYMAYVRAALNLVGKKSPALLAEVKEVKDHGERNTRTIVLTPEQSSAWISAAEARIADLIEATLRMGCRPGDLPRMRRSDYDATPGAESIRLTTKNAERWVPLPPAAIPLLERLAKGCGENDFLFRRTDGTPWPLNRSTWTRDVSAAARAAGLPPGCCLYTLRHTFITTAINDGFKVENIAKLCGTSLRMIEKHYHKLLNKEARDIVATVSVLGKSKRSNVIAFPAHGTPAMPANPAAVTLARTIARLPRDRLVKALASMPMEALAHVIEQAEAA